MTSRYFWFFPLLLICLFFFGRSFSVVIAQTLPLTRTSLQPEIEYEEGVVLVRYTPGTMPHGRYAHEWAGAQRYGKKAPSAGSREFWRLAINDHRSVSEVIAELAEDPSVLSAEPNIIRRIAVVPDDPFYSVQWYLQADAGIDATAAWDIQTGSKDAVVAVIDTGIDLDHPDLADNIWANPDEIADNDIDDDGNGYVDDLHGYDFVDDDTDPTPTPDGKDNDGYAGVDTGVTHGTHVAGIAAAVGNNSVGVSGVVWTASIVPVRVLDDEGAGSDAAIAEGITYAADLGVDVINMSLGGFGSTSVLKSAVKYAKDRGVLIVAAVGNDGADIDKNPFYPACYDGVLGVGSTADDNSASSFSNYGTDCVDLSAPGESIISTIYTDDPAYGFTADYGVMSGSSMAAPIVSGSVLLLRSEENTLKRSELIDILTLTAEDVGLEEEYGSGRLDAYNALTGIDIINRPSSTSEIQAYNSPKKKKQYVSGQRSADRSPYFTWPEVADDDGIAGYSVYFGTSKKVDPVTEGTFQTSRTFEPDPIAGNATSYYLRVVTHDGAGNTSSEVASFEYRIDTMVARPQKLILRRASDGVSVYWKKVRKEHVQKYKVVRLLVGKNDTIARRVVGIVKQPNHAFIDRSVVPERHYRYRVRAVDDLKNQSTSGKESTTFFPRKRIVMGAGKGGSPFIRIYNVDTKQFEQSWYAFDSSHRSGVEIAVGNVDDDTADEIIAAEGEGAPLVKIFSTDGSEEGSFFAYDQSFQGGVRVAAADIDNDGVAEIITAPGKGMVPLIRIFDREGTEKASWAALDGKFNGGVFVAGINWDGKGRDEIAVAPDAPGGPQVLIYSAGGESVSNFFAYESSERRGMRIASARQEGVAQETLLTIPQNGTVNVHRFRLMDGKPKQIGNEFFGFVQTYAGGGTIAAGDVDQIHSDRFIIGSNGDRQATVQVYTATGATLLSTIFPLGTFSGPVHVAAGWVY